MVKIKVEKKMNFLELVQWAWNRDVGAVFYSNRTGGSVVIENNTIMTEHEINKDETFTVVVEEEVTKYSEIPNLFELYDLETGKGPEALMHQNALVNNFIGNEAVIALYAMNDDYTLTLLWTREGSMVE